MSPVGSLATFIETSEVWSLNLRPSESYPWSGALSKAAVGSDVPARRGPYSTITFGGDIFSDTTIPSLVGDRHLRPSMCSPSTATPTVAEPTRPNTATGDHKRETTSFYPTPRREISGDLGEPHQAHGESIP